MNMDMYLLLPLVTVLAVITPAQNSAVQFELPGKQNPHCQPKLCSIGTTHVACTMLSKDFHSSCAMHGTRLLNLEPYADIILKQHNERRQRVASGKNPTLPRSARMVIMRWSEELAAVASYSARSCQAKHDSCRNTQKFKHSGQNIIVFNLTRLVNDDTLVKLYPELISTAARTWWREHVNITHDRLVYYSCETKKQEHQYRHFAVMAWESNNYVGCAAVRFDVDKSTYFKLTCNYAKDYVCNRPIYHIYPQKCKTGKNKMLNGLCSIREKFPINPITT